MPTPRPEALALGERYRLTFPYEPRRGPVGERAARGTGASLEFHDRRPYVAGDDVRNLDWKAYARTDQLLVRQYREELLPVVDVVLDGSRSMALDPEKAQRAVDLAGLLVESARTAGARPELLLLTDEPRRISFEEFASGGVPFVGRRPSADLLREAQGLLRAGGLRVFLSDFLFPHDPRNLVALCGRGGGRSGGGLAFVQILARGDLAPPLEKALRLTDVETGEALDMVLDAPAHERYRLRLERLISGLELEARRVRAGFFSLSAATDLELVCRDELAPSGFLTPA